jgi:hypothetical protein
MLFPPVIGFCFVKWHHTPNAMDVNVGAQRCGAEAALFAIAAVYNARRLISTDRNSQSGAKKTLQY